MNMILHIWKLIRSRLGGSSWILAELGVVFLVMFVITDYFVAQWRHFGEPVGFRVDDVYLATLSVRPSNSPSFIAYGEGSDEPLRNLGRIAEHLAQHPDVEAVGLSYLSLPYTFSNMETEIEADSSRLRVRSLIVSPGYFRVFGIRSAAGGSPEELGELLRGIPEKGPCRMISLDVARKLYGRDDVVGAEVYDYGDSIPRRVMVVTEGVRNSELESRLPYAVFSLLDLPSLCDRYQLKEDKLKQVQITFRVRPGMATADYGTRFLKETRQSLRAGNYWVSEVRPYTSIREAYLENSPQRYSQKLVSVLGAFLLVNVFLAVTGTFWFHVNRRRSELGLRMVVGSTRLAVQGLMIGEGLMLLFIASVPALLICANLTYADLLPCSGATVPATRFALVTLLTWLTLATIIFLGTWYPARKAARLEPVETLRCE